MDLKKNGISSRRPKRTPKVEDNSWDCSVCTYRNTAEAFKCLMCDVRKGTSTRKPRINPQLVPNFNPSPPKLKKEKMDRKLDTSSSQRRPRPKLKNVDRSSAQHKEVTVNNVTVIITEFKPKVKLSPNAEPGETLGSSTASESHSELSNDARNGESSDSRSS